MSLRFMTESGHAEILGESLISPLETWHLHAEKIDPRQLSTGTAGVNPPTTDPSKIVPISEDWL